MTDAADPDALRARSRESWEQAASGWGQQADGIQRWAIPVSATMVDALALQPGDRVLELAAGPGDTGFMAAELIAPGGTLISSDGAEAMVAVARARAAAQGIANVEFRQLELEWIDLPTADVDAVLCRWGLMLTVDPEAAAREIRRVLRPGGRVALAVWDRAEKNPWITIPNTAMERLGHTPPPDPAVPGMFSLAADGALRQLLESAGLIEVKIAAVSLERRFDGLNDYVTSLVEMSGTRGSVWEQLTAAQRAEVEQAIAAAAEPYTAADGSLALPGSSLVAAAAA